MFCSLPIKSCHEFFELSLATTINLLTLVSCDQMTSINYDDKKPRDVGLTWWCHLSNIMSDRISHESTIWRMTCSGLFCFYFYFFVSMFVWLFVVCFFYGVILGVIQHWTQVKDYWLPGLIRNIRLRIGISRLFISGISHLSITGIVVHGRCYIFHCFCFSVIF